ncbi:MAG TPA: UrcA family protein [Caulobacteraceae bacterium]|nr:UrcA family protein [Caulobacteraceae bacterium]
MRLAEPLAIKIGFAALAGAALIAMLPSRHAATAAATPESGPYSQDVTVLAPEVVRERVGRGRHLQPVYVASLSMKVSYADLDLTKASDQKVFKDRITAKAREACQDLDRRTPVKIYQPPVNTPCIGDAIAEANRVADEVIAAVNQPATAG